MYDLAVLRVWGWVGPKAEADGGADAGAVFGRHGACCAELWEWVYAVWVWGREFESGEVLWDVCGQ